MDGGVVIGGWGREGVERVRRKERKEEGEKIKGEREGVVEGGMEGDSNGR